MPMKIELIFRHLYLMWLLSQMPMGLLYLERKRTAGPAPLGWRPRTVGESRLTSSRPLDAEAALVQRAGLPWDFLVVHVATWRGLVLWKGRDFRKIHMLKFMHRDVYLSGVGVGRTLPKCRREPQRPTSAAYRPPPPNIGTTLLAPTQAGFPLCE